MPLEADPETSPTFDVVRVEPTGEAVLAGRAAPGASIEVLSDKKVVARTKAGDGGDWVAVPDAPLAPGSHDLSLQAKGEDGVGRASQERVAVAVPEKRHDGVLVVVGRAGAPSRVLTTPDAAGDEPAHPTPLTIARAETSAGPGGSADADAAAPPVLTVEAVEAEGGTLYVAGASAPGGLVRVYVDDIHVGDATAGPSGRWLLESNDGLPAKSLTLTIRADRLQSGGSRVEARALVPFVRRLDTAALMPAAAVGSGSSAISSARPLPEPNAIIIRRGDNLWTISRRAYGRGTRYTTIYGANTEQIRDPDLIYPGQVFVMPTGDRTWTE